MNRYMKSLFGLSLLLCLVGLHSCSTVRLINDYDEITDKTINSLQEDVSRLLVSIETHLGTDQAKYEHYAKNYEDMKVKLKILETRVAILDKNRIISGQVAELKTILSNVEKLHRIGFTNIDQLKLLDSQMTTLFSSLIRFQVALKRGETTNYSNK